MNNLFNPGVYIVITRPNGTQDSFRIDEEKSKFFENQMMEQYVRQKPVEEKFCRKTEAELKYLTNTKTLVHHLNWNAWLPEKPPEPPKTDAAIGIVVIISTIVLIGTFIGIATNFGEKKKEDKPKNRYRDWK
ncbi:hypothetical protein phiOC_p106 [Ochrobactrum phage vB_OspM_OC]|nr:hypothetical protein phiOC_p106 [Ochrobactrum phage vB_OspM_OC]